MRQGDDGKKDLRGNVALEWMGRAGTAWIQKEIVHRRVGLAVGRERHEAVLHSTNTHRRGTSIAVEGYGVIALSRQHCIAIDTARQAHRIEIDGNDDQRDESGGQNGERR